MASCPNYNIPIYNKIISIYGIDAGKEIIDTLHDNSDFEDWYGSHSATISNLSYHKIYNTSGDYLDLREFIVDMKDSYEEHIDKYISLYLSEDITKKELENIYNQSDVNVLSKRVQKLVNTYNSSNISNLIDNDYNRILNSEDKDLTIDELQVKRGIKSKEEYYKYTDNVEVMLNKLSIKYDDENIRNLYDYLGVDIQEFEKIVEEVNNKC